jgi:hypothetical protein
MKKFLFFLAITTSFLFSLLSLTSCTKERIRSAIVYTDNPPKELWSSNQNYLQTYLGYVERKDFITEKKGYFNAPNTGMYQNYQSGTWYLMKIRKYYGMINGKIYISNSFENAAVFSETLLDVQDVIERTGAVKVNIGAWFMNNPIGADYTIYSVAQ